MPIAITNAQARISGEILSSTISDITATMTLTDQYQLISQSDMGFDSDRKGDILITFEVYAQDKYSADIDPDATLEQWQSNKWHSSHHCRLW